MRAQLVRPADPGLGTPASLSPQHVANELAATHQAAATRRNDAALRRAEAVTADVANRDRLHQEADQTDALAEPRAAVGPAR